MKSIIFLSIGIPIGIIWGIIGMICFYHPQISDSQVKAIVVKENQITGKAFDDCLNKNTQVYTMNGSNWMSADVVAKCIKQNFVSANN